MYALRFNDGSVTVVTIDNCDSFKSVLLFCGLGVNKTGILACIDILLFTIQLKSASKVHWPPLSTPSESVFFICLFLCVCKTVWFKIAVPCFFNLNTFFFVGNFVETLWKRYFDSMKLGEKNTMSHLFSYTALINTAAAATTMVWCSKCYK